MEQCSFLCQHLDGSDVPLVDGLVAARDRHDCKTCRRDRVRKWAVERSGRLGGCTCEVDDGVGSCYLNRHLEGDRLIADAVVVEDS